MVQEKLKKYTYWCGIISFCHAVIPLYSTKLEINNRSGETIDVRVHYNTKGWKGAYNIPHGGKATISAADCFNTKKVGVSDFIYVGPSKDKRNGETVWYTFREKKRRIFPCTNAHIFVKKDARNFFYFD